MQNHLNIDLGGGNDSMRITACVYVSIHPFIHRSIYLSVCMCMALVQFCGAGQGRGFHICFATARGTTCCQPSCPACKDPFLCAWDDHLPTSPVLGMLIQSKKGPLPLVSISMYVCVYIYMCVCLCVCVYVCMYACMHACMYVCMCVCVYAGVCRCMQVYVCVCMWVYTCIFIYTCRYIYTCIYIYTQYYTVSFVHLNPIFSGQHFSCRVKSQLLLVESQEWTVQAPSGAAVPVKRSLHLRFPQGGAPDLCWLMTPMNYRLYIWVWINTY